MFKDFEQNQCHTPDEPSAAYLQAWYQTVAASSYKVGFYGNSFSQTNQFPKAFCAAAGAVPGMVSQVTLSASEPEPNFNSAIGTTGPGTAPAWAATTPSCAPAGATQIWQYGEVGSQVGNIADIDEFRPGMPGLVAPNGSITSSQSGSVPDRNLVSDGGFNGSSVGWHNGASTNYVVYPSGSGGTTSFEGSGYLATNTTSGAGGVYQDIPAAISAGQTFCASMELTTGDGGSGATGALVLWLTGGLSNENGMRVASNLPGGSTWTQEQTCVMATTAHTALRVQLYPAAGGPSVAIDDVSVTPDLAVNGGFNNVDGSWRQTLNSNSFRFTGQAGWLPYEGAGFMAVNASATNGSIFEDLPTNIVAGDTYCASAELTGPDSTTAGGALVIWLLGLSAPESGLTVANNLPGPGNWKLVKTCVQATAGHSVIRIQVYPNPGGPTVGVDAVSVL